MLLSDSTTLADVHSNRSVLLFADSEPSDLLSMGKNFSSREVGDGGNAAILLAESRLAEFFPPSIFTYPDSTMVLRLGVALATVGLLLVFANLLDMNPLERLIFVPDSVLLATPRQLGLEYEDVEFSTADGVRLHGWYVPGTRSETLLWFHGNAGNISHRLDNLRLLHDHVGIGVFLFDYRGYGRSEGRPSERGLYDDARAALQQLVTRLGVSHENVIYFGRSLGSAVAVELATEKTPRGLILETPFASIRALARSLFGPLAVVAPSGFDNLSKIPGLKCPKLFIHGDSDSLVPYIQGRQLFEAALPPKAFYTIRGADHNDTYIVGGSTYFHRIREFVDGLGAKSA